MSYLIVFLLPSIFGLKFIMKFNENRSIKDIIIDYLLLVVLSNFYFNGDLKSSKKDKKDYNDSYKDFLLSIEDSDSIED